MKKLKLILAILMMQIICMGQIINVPNDQPTIQAGINASSSGDTVLVEDGTYYENIRFMGKAITVASHFLMDDDTSHISNTIIDGSQASNPDSASCVMFVNSEDTTSVLSGFTITGGAGLLCPSWQMKMGGGVACYLAGAKITDNKIINNIVSNTSYPSGGGIGYMAENSNGWIVVLDNTIKDNTVVADEQETYGGGIYVMGNARIESNVIDNNYCHLLSASGEIQGGGLFAESSSSNPLNTLILNNNNIQNNILEGGERAVGGGIACGDFFFCPVLFITNNTIVNNTILGVEMGWGSGMYLTNIQGEIFISGNNVQFNSVTSGIACGTAIFIDQPMVKAHILDNLITDNWADGNDYTWAAGIWLYDAENVNVTVDGNIIKNNTGRYCGGFCVKNSYNFHLTNNIFAGNNVEVLAGVVYLFQNYGAGDKLFPYGGHAHTFGEPKQLKSGSINPVIANNTFTNNSAGDCGGAIYINSNYDSARPIIFNNIFWDNDASYGKDIYHGGDEAIYVGYNDIDINGIQGNWTGENNIDFDPLFIDPTNDDFHLDPNSPCAGEGIDSLDVFGIMCFCPSFDFENDSRPIPFTAMPDMGADEVDESNGIPKLHENQSPISMNIYPNPFSSVTTIGFSLPESDFVSLSVYDITGKQLETILSEKLSKGNHKINWNAENLNEGIYFIRIKTNNGMQTRKLIKL